MMQLQEQLFKNLDRYENKIVTYHENKIVTYHENFDLKKYELRMLLKVACIQGVLKVYWYFVTHFMVTVFCFTVK